jgi:bla regulator protein blaR1
MAISTLRSLTLLLVVASLMRPANPNSGQTSASIATDNTKREQSAVYLSRRYGFTVILPKSWKGYAVIPGTWTAADIQTGNVESGPSITIRHPLWTDAVPRQDIPILVLTTAQWNQKQQFSFGAAPFGPSEIAHNAEFVFALPARYNYAFPFGYEEVEQILRGRPFRTFQPKNASR